MEGFAGIVGGNFDMRPWSIGRENVLRVDVAASVEPYAVRGGYADGNAFSHANGRIGRVSCIENGPHAKMPRKEAGRAGLTACLKRHALDALRLTFYV
jgi:hypothetical protein